MVCFRQRVCPYPGNEWYSMSHNNTFTTSREGSCERTRLSAYCLVSHLFYICFSLCLYVPYIVCSVIPLLFVVRDICGFYNPDVLDLRHEFFDYSILAAPNYFDCLHKMINYTSLWNQRPCRSLQRRKNEAKFTWTDIPLKPPFLQDLLLHLSLLMRRLWQQMTRRQSVVTPLFFWEMLVSVYGCIGIWLYWQIPCHR